MKKVKIREISKGFVKNGINYSEACKVNFTLSKTKEKSKKSK